MLYDWPPMTGSFIARQVCVALLSVPVKSTNKMVLLLSSDWKYWFLASAFGKSYKSSVILTGHKPCVTVESYFV